MIPVIDLTRVLEWGFNAVIWFIKWAAIRAFTISAIIIVVPVAMYNAYFFILEKLFAYMNTLDTSDSVWSGTVIQFTGMAAWLADKLKFQQCLSVIISVLLIKFALSFIKI